MILFFLASRPASPKSEKNIVWHFFTFWPAGNFFSLRSLSGARPAISFHSGRAGLAGLWEDEDYLRRQNLGRPLLLEDEDCLGRQNLGRPPKVNKNCSGNSFHFLGGRQFSFTQIPIWSEAGNFFSLWPGWPGWAVGGRRLPQTACWARPGLGCWRTKTTSDGLAEARPR